MKKSVCGIGMSLLITLSFVAVVGLVSSIAAMTIENFEDHISLISGAAQLIYLGAAVFTLHLRKINISERFGLVGGSPVLFLLSTGTGFCFSSFSNILQELIPIPRELTGEMTDSFGKSIIAFIAAIYIVAPFTEEFVFRGLILTKLRESVKAAPAIIISALLFGVIHLMTGSVITGIHALIGGIIFGLAYEKSGSLFAAVAAHIAGNLGGLVPIMLGGNTGLQLVLAVITGAAAAGLCMIMIKQEDKRGEGK